MLKHYKSRNEEEIGVWDNTTEMRNRDRIEISKMWVSRKIKKEVLTRVKESTRSVLIRNLKWIGN